MNSMPVHTHEQVRREVGCNKPSTVQNGRDRPSLLSALIMRGLLALIYGGCLFLQAMLRPVGWLFRRLPRIQAKGRPDSFRLLVLGTFYTRNWCLSHLTPLARAANVCEVIAVVDGPTQPIEKVCYVQPPRWMVRLFGRAISKLFCALRCAWQAAPDLIMGYHLLPGALLALLVARATGARCGYQVTGGPLQLIGGGSQSENVLLRKLGRPSWLLERLAFALARRFDLIVVRGRSALEFMQQSRLGRHACIVPGSIDTGRFDPSLCRRSPYGPTQASTSSPQNAKTFEQADLTEDSGSFPQRKYDLVTVSRLVEVKQPDHVLRITADLAQRRPRIKVAIVGDGPLLEPLRKLAQQLGIESNIEFRGHVETVEEILIHSKIFLLTSRSEGLSIALAEAMAAGIVPVVSDVGDLGDLVRNGETGWRVAPGDIKGFADRIEGLLGDLHDWRRQSHAARAAAIEYNGIDGVAGRWAKTFEKVCGPRNRVEVPGRTQPRRLPSKWRLWDGLPAPWKRRVGHLAGRVPPSWFLGSRFRSTRGLLRRSETWPSEVIDAYRLEQIRRICTLANERSSYYRAVFNNLGFDPRELGSLHDLHHLPTIDKQVLRDHLEDLCTVAPSSPGVERVSTGGTSGVPLNFYIGTQRSGIEYAYLVHAWGRVGYELHQSQAILRGRVVQPDRSGLRHEFDPILRRHYYSAFHMTDECLRRYVDHIAGIGPCYLHVYPSSLDVLAKFLERTGTPAPGNIRGILAGSEIVYPENRARAERVFGVRYFSWYGHSEKLVLAAECEHGSDYHVFPTYGYLELLDEAGHPVTTPGTVGEIVGTGFMNSVTPFIRYRTGDHATYVGDHCEACGRRQMILRDIRGHRTQEVLVAKDGSVLFWTALNMHDDTFDRVQRFQFVQTEVGRATLRVIPAQGFSTADEARILRSLELKLAGRLTVCIERCKDIPLTRMGKATYVDQKLSLEDRARNEERKIAPEPQGSARAKKRHSVVHSR